MNDRLMLLERLAASDEAAVRLVLAPQLPPRAEVAGRSLAAKTRMLIRLAALLAVGASTTSLLWAVELARAAGADDDEIVEVLETVACSTGLARVVASAPRLALAIGYDMGIDDLDE